VSAHIQGSLTFCSLILTICSSLFNLVFRDVCSARCRHNGFSSIRLASVSFFLADFDSCCNFFTCSFKSVIVFVIASPSFLSRPNELPRSSSSVKSSWFL
jgi:hypothetical protein